MLQKHNTANSGTTIQTTHRVERRSRSHSFMKASYRTVFSLRVSDEHIALGGSEWFVADSDIT